MRLAPVSSGSACALATVLFVSGCCTSRFESVMDQCCAPRPSCSTACAPCQLLHPEPIEPTWPGDHQGLVLAWNDGRPSNLKKWGKAYINAAGIMELSNGALLPEGVDGRLLEACSRSNELSIELVLMTKNEKQSGPARIVSFSTDANRRNFTLGQDRGQLVFRLRTSRNDLNGTNPEVKLCPIKPNRPMHVIVSYRRNEMVCYVDGREVSKTDAVKGDFGNWTPQRLIFGDEMTKDRDWSGTIERVAIRSRSMNAGEARRQFELMVSEMDRE